MGDFHAGLLGEHRHRQMAKGADADGGVFDRAGVAFEAAGEKPGHRNRIGKNSRSIGSTVSALQSL
jgi:hypothetical protein